MFRKLIAPVIITAILAVIFLTYIFLFTVIPIPIPFRLIGILVESSLLGVSIYVLVERIREVRSGEEDDLSKY